LAQVSMDHDIDGDINVMREFELILYFLLSLVCFFNLVFIFMFSPTSVIWWKV